MVGTCLGYCLFMVPAITWPATVFANSTSLPGVMAYDLRDGSVKRICRNLCFVMWTGDGKFLCVSVFDKRDQNQTLPTRKTFLIPLRGGKSFRHCRLRESNQTPIWLGFRAFQQSMS
jgi:hypothetical protein